MGTDKRDNLARVRRNLPNHLKDTLSEAISLISEAEGIEGEGRAEAIEMATYRIDSMIYLLNQARRMINH